MLLIQTQAFQGLGVAGEQHLSDDGTVWVTKTHFPFHIFTEPQFDADKVFIITRNPIDVFMSTFLLINTGSHSATCQENVQESFPQEWDYWVRGSV